MKIESHPILHILALEVPMSLDDRQEVSTLPHTIKHGNICSRQDCLHVVDKIATYVQDKDLLCMHLSFGHILVCVSLAVGKERITQFLLIFLLFTVHLTQQTMLLGTIWNNQH